MPKKNVRHILGLSGGKDSTALAVLLHESIPNMEYFFCDTKKELDETYEYLERIKARLGIKITTLSDNRGFDHWLQVYGGMLPSPNARWCTKQLKIVPLEQFIGDDEAYSYVGIRADENRDGYISSNPKIKPVYPYKGSSFVAFDELGKVRYDQRQLVEELKDQGVALPISKDGFSIREVTELLNKSGIGMPKYYSWRSRSGCFFCFFQRKYEWVMLAEKHPDLFEKAAQYEENHSDGRRFYWTKDESLRELVKRKDQIISEYQRSLERKTSQVKNKSLSEVLSSLDDDQDQSCTICHI